MCYRMRPVPEAHGMRRGFHLDAGDGQHGKFGLQCLPHRTRPRLGWPSQRRHRPVEAALSLRDEQQACSD